MSMTTQPTRRQPPRLSQRGEDFLYNLLRRQGWGSGVLGLVRLGEYPKLLRHLRKEPLPYLDMLIAVAVQEPARTRYYDAFLAQVNALAIANEASSFTTAEWLPLLLVTPFELEQRDIDRIHRAAIKAEVLEWVAPTMIGKDLVPSLKALEADPHLVCAEDAPAFERLRAMRSARDLEREMARGRSRRKRPEGVASPQAGL